MNAKMSSSDWKDILIPDRNVINVLNDTLIYTFHFDQNIFCIQGMEYNYKRKFYF